MIDCISVANMRESDAYTIANLVPSLELMHRAAYGVFKAVEWKKRTAIVVGSGNNGGDGFALACILQENGYACSIFTISNHLSADSAYYAEKAKVAGILITPFMSGCLSGYDTVVDCLLGTGFQGALREEYRNAISAINAADAYVVSVDINSGMNGDSGMAEMAVCSDVTVTIGYVKTGLILENAAKYVKRLCCVDIGIVLAKEEAKIYTPQEWQQLPPNCRNGYLCPPWLDMKILHV